MAGKEVILGIDLGSSFSSAGASIDSRVVLVEDGRGEACIPSVVHFPKNGPPVVGIEAVRMRRIDPQNTVSGVKRILGRVVASPELRLFEANNAVALKPSTSGIPVLQLGGKEHTPVSVAAAIFEYLKQRAEKRFGVGINKAVMTMPVTATPETRAALCQAARMAGIETVGTLSEPVAGAIACGVTNLTPNQRILVYDFGGGTFDCSILTKGGNGIITLAAGGDSCLGGEDFDHALARLIGSYIWERHRRDVTNDVIRWERIVEESERTKRALSAEEGAPFRIDDAYYAEGASQDLQVMITRENADAAWRVLVDRSVKATVEMMVKAGLRPADLDRVFLIGGTTYVQLVRKMVAQVLGRPGVTQGDPQTSVVIGAIMATTPGLRNMCSESPLKRAGSSV